MTAVGPLQCPWVLIAATTTTTTTITSSSSSSGSAFCGRVERLAIKVA
jgi:hypothetical protein